MKIERELQNGHSQRTIAEKYGVAKSMVDDIWKYPQKLKDCILLSETLLYVKRRCVMRGPKYDVVVSG